VDRLARLAEPLLASDDDAPSAHADRPCFEGGTVVHGQHVPGRPRGDRDPKAPLPSDEQIREGFTTLKQRGRSTKGSSQASLRHVDSAEGEEVPLARGSDGSQVNALTPRQAIAIYQVSQYDQYYDEM